MKEQYIEVREDTQRLHKFGRRIGFREYLEVYNSAIMNYAINQKLSFLVLWLWYKHVCHSKLDDTVSLLYQSKWDDTGSLLSSDRGWPWG